MLIQIVVLVEMLPIAIESETTQTLQDKDLNGFFLGGESQVERWMFTRSAAPPRPVSASFLCDTSGQTAQHPV